jgi:inosine/xanthosine triphosphate pyrophosphatase family protein
MPIDKRLLKSESLIWMINCKRLRVLSLKKGNDVVWRVVRMELIYGTRNPAKVMSMKKMLSGLYMQLRDLCSSKHLPIVEEIGSSPLDNVRAKAETYYRFIGRPTFACDSGLFVEELDSELQPRVKFRRLGDKPLNDEEMINH